MKLDQLKMGECAWSDDTRYGEKTASDNCILCQFNFQFISWTKHVQKF